MMPVWRYSASWSENKKKKQFENTNFEAEKKYLNKIIASILIFSEYYINFALQQPRVLKTFRDKSSCFKIEAVNLRNWKVIQS